MLVENFALRIRILKVIFVSVSSRNSARRRYTHTLIYIRPVVYAGQFLEGHVRK